MVPLYARVNAQYILQTCRESSCTDSDIMEVSGTMVDSVGYVKASNTGTSDWFSIAISLSADGGTLAIGASLEASNAVDGEEDDSAVGAGAVYVFTRGASTWVQQAYLKASNTDGGDHFGEAVSLSGDGGTLAVGAPLEASNATGVNSDQRNNDADAAGAVYVFSRRPIDPLWSQSAYLKASNTDAGDRFGEIVSLRDIEDADLSA